MMLLLYRAAETLAAPLIRHHLEKRKSRGKEDPARFAERMGQAGHPRPSGPLVWLHGASVGEALSTLPLIERFRQDHPGIHVLLTTGTVTSASLMGQRLPDGAVHQFVPVDRAPWVRSFLDHWRPDLVLWMESEFWPNLTSETARRGIPMILVNGRVSMRSFGRWGRAPFVIRRLLANFELCLGQTDADADRLRRLGAKQAACVGNLKYAVPPLPVDEPELQRLSGLIGDRPRWLAASTHPGEEAAVGRIHGTLKASRPGLLSLIVPRHPERGPAIRDELSALGLTVALRSGGQTPTADTDVFIADTIGELGLFYRLCGIVFIGKSLLASGGQNPLEAAHLDSALLFGPRMENFAAMAATFLEAQAALTVDDEAGLGQAVARLLDDPAERTRLAQSARILAQSEAAVLDRLMITLTPWLNKLDGGGHAHP